jgi:hypothetical protein
MLLINVIDKPFEKLLENWPEGAIFLLILVGVVIVVRRIDKFLYKRIDPLESSIQEHSKTVEKYKELANCVNHTSSINELQRALNNIERILIRMDSTNLDALSVVNSPRQLNDLGRKFFEESGSEKLLKENIDDFINNLETKDLKTALDVETECYIFLLKISNDERFNDVKKYIYNNPKVGNLDVDISTSCFVIGLELRNEYLKRHPEVDQNL